MPQWPVSAAPDTPSFTLRCKFLGSMVTVFCAEVSIQTIIVTLKSSYEGAPQRDDARTERFSSKKIVYPSELPFSVTILWSPLLLLRAQLHLLQDSRAAFAPRCWRQPAHPSPQTPFLNFDAPGLQTPPTAHRPCAPSSRIFALFLHAQVCLCRTAVSSCYLQSICVQWCPRPG